MCAKRTFWSFRAFTIVIRRELDRVFDHRQAPVAELLIEALEN